MADNYLERRQAEINEGHAASYRRVGATLETLLAKCKAGGNPDNGYKVHRMQLEAIISVCGRLEAKGLTMHFGQDVPGEESSAYIEIIPDGTLPPGIELFTELGRMIQTATLKAAEMGLSIQYNILEDNKIQLDGDNISDKPLARLRVEGKCR